MCCHPIVQCQLYSDPTFHHTNRDLLTAMLFTCHGRLVANFPKDKMKVTRPYVSTKSVHAKAGTQFFLYAVGVITRRFHDTLNEDATGQHAHLRSLINVVREVAVVHVLERLYRNNAQRLYNGQSLCNKNTII